MSSRVRAPWFALLAVIGGSAAIIAIIAILGGLEVVALAAVVAAATVQLRRALVEAGRPDRSSSTLRVDLHDRERRRGE